MYKSIQMLEKFSLTDLRNCVQNKTISSAKRKQIQLFMEQWKKDFKLIPPLPDHPGNDLLIDAGLSLLYKASKDAFGEVRQFIKPSITTGSVGKEKGTTICEPVYSDDIYNKLQNIVEIINNSDSILREQYGADVSLLTAVNDARVNHDGWAVLYYDKKIYDKEKKVLSSGTSGYQTQTAQKYKEALIKERLLPYHVNAIVVSLQNQSDNPQAVIQAYIELGRFLDMSGISEQNLQVSSNKELNKKSEKSLSFTISNSNGSTINSDVNIEIVTHIQKALGITSNDNLCQNDNMTAKASSLSNGRYSDKVNKTTNEIPKISDNYFGLIDKFNKGIEFFKTRHMIIPEPTKRVRLNWSTLAKSAKTTKIKPNNFNIDIIEQAIADCFFIDYADNSMRDIQQAITDLKQAIDKLKMNQESLLTQSQIDIKLIEIELGIKLELHLYQFLTNFTNSKLLTTGPKDSERQQKKHLEIFKNHCTKAINAAEKQIKVDEDEQWKSTRNHLLVCLTGIGILFTLVSLAWKGVTGRSLMFDYKPDLPEILRPRAAISTIAQKPSTTKIANIHTIVTHTTKLKENLGKLKQNQVLPQTYEKQLEDQQNKCHMIKKVIAWVKKNSQLSISEIKNLSHKMISNIFQSTDPFYTVLHKIVDDKLTNPKTTQSQTNSPLQEKFKKFYDNELSGLGLSTLQDKNSDIEEGEGKKSVLA